MKNFIRFDTNHSFSSELQPNSVSLLVLGRKERTRLKPDSFNQMSPRFLFHNSTVDCTLEYSAAKCSFFFFWGGGCLCVWVCGKGHSQTRAFQWKTDVYFQAAYLPDRHSFKLRHCCFFHLKQNMSSIGPTCVFTTLWLHVSKSCVSAWHNGGLKT